MRYHDIERLKQAASRVNGFAGTLADFEELTDYAIDKLDEPSGVRKVDNNDGTVTIHGLPVTVPSTLIPDGEVPVEVRSRTLIRRGRRIGFDGKIRTDEIKSAGEPGGLRITLADKPAPITWTPPASLSNGEWRWYVYETHGKSGNCISNDKHGFNAELRQSIFRDWTDPPRLGRYKVENGTAVWLGE